MRSTGFFVLFSVALLVLTTACSGVAYRRGTTTNSATDYPLFGVLDADNNGALDPYEALAQLLAVESQLAGKALTTETLSKMLAAQHKAARTEALAMLDSLDANGDGQTAITELDASMRDFASLLDRNEDGVISLDEALNAEVADAFFMSPEDIDQATSEVFADMDTNRDDILVEAECEPEDWREFQSGDQNGDGRVTRAELRAFLTADNTAADFTIDGDQAVMAGVIGPSTPARVLRLALEHPTVRTIVMNHVPGSMDDEANLQAARFVRHFGFTTVLQSRSMVASGGTDFFLAGEKRLVEEGAKVGIHSWGGPGYQGKDVAKDDPQHRLYLDCYKEMGIAAAFYWRTLEAAPADDIYWMTEDELQRFRFRTATK